jgi:hypothetical protein
MVQFPIRRAPVRPGEKKKNTSPPPHGTEQRRGVRLNSCVPIALEWDSGGEIHHGEAKTRVIGHYGCLVVIPLDLAVEQRLQLTNLTSSESSPAVVVWRGSKRPEGWELGIELINPGMGFWGLEL